MTDERVAYFVKKYDMYKKPNGQIWARITPSKEDAAEIQPAREEFMAYFKRLEDEEKAKSEKAKERDRRVASIPGVKEIREAEDALWKWRRDFNRAMERGDGIIPTKKVKESDLEDLIKKYPDADFALKVEDERYSDNYEIAAIARRAYDAIGDGLSVAEVKVRYEKEKDEFVKRHMWD